MDDELRDQVRHLTDRAEIHDYMQRYARGIDRQDRALLRSAYHDGAIDGDEAHAETYYLFVGTDREPANHMTVSEARHVDRLERREGRWAIVDRVCLVEFMNESQSLLTDTAIAMVPGTRTPRHDRTDASYDRPLAASRAAADIVDQISAQP
ncbi:nuclear transport factor 2 family protein [Mycobacterium sp. MUNTM1]